MSVVLLATFGLNGPANAAAGPTGCATAGSSFALEPISGGGSALRLGCARDAGGFRSLADDDDDFIAVVDFAAVERPEQLRQSMRQVVDTTRADQARGLSLSQAFTVQAQRHSPGVYPQQNDDVRYGGSIREGALRGPRR